MKIKVVIDRFDGEYAVCEKEDRSMLNIPRSHLPVGVKESDVLVIEGDKIQIEVKETECKKAKTAKITKDLWK
ncbi:MAG TPA: DUF3006 domain-containing protein [Dehalococcoidales bacterium]|nr:DUF3006 domain-containing protein [Dehalococcoidales bacterium]